MTSRMTPLEYARSVRQMHGDNTRVAWMTVSELIDFLEQLYRYQELELKVLKELEDWREMDRHEMEARAEEYRDEEYTRRINDPH